MKKMLIKKKRIDIGEAKDQENMLAENETLKSIIEYNVMMGNIEDPAEEEEEA